MQETAGRQNLCKKLLQLDYSLGLWFRNWLSNFATTLLSYTKKKPPRTKNQIPVDDCITVVKQGNYVRLATEAQ